MLRPDTRCGRRNAHPRRTLDQHVSEQVRPSIARTMCGTTTSDGDTRGAGMAVSIGEKGEEYTVYPALSLDVGHSHVRSDGIAIRRYTTHYSCSCPAWRFQRTAVQHRTCTHLADTLGDEFERVRMIRAAHEVESISAPPRTPTKRRYHNAISPGTPSPVSSEQNTPRKKHDGSNAPIMIEFSGTTIQIGKRTCTLLLTVARASRR